VDSRLEECDRRLDLLIRWLASDEIPRPRDPGHAAALVGAAMAQGLAGLLDEALLSGADALSSWPDEARRRLRSAHLAQLALVLQRLTVASDIQRALEAAGLRSLALKGCAFADTLYDSPGHRPMDDVDILVLDDWQAARQVLEAQGYEPEIRGDHAWGFRRREAAALRPGPAQANPSGGGPAEALERGAPSLYVELHAAVVSAPGAFRVDAEGLWARSRMVPDPLRRVPSTEDLAVLASLHLAFQHGLSARLVQWLDLRRLLEHPTMDESSLIDRARQWGAGPVLALALAAAEVLVGARVSPVLRGALAAPRPLLRQLRRRSAASLAASGLPLALTRWHLSHGRRLAFLLDTLAPLPLDGRSGAARPLLGIPRRVAGLLARHAAPG